MGINGLWNVLAPATKHCTLGEFAIEGFKSHEEGAPRILTAGFNASSWMHNLCSGFTQRLVGTRKSPETRIIFSRLVALSEIVLCAHFVFDGPSHPQPKPGKEAKAVPFLLTQHFQEMLTAFGFSWHVAPGLADAELAQLNSQGLVDVVVTDGDNALLFGSTAILRSPPRARTFEDVKLYTSDALEHGVHLTQGGLVLIALLCGGDYSVGIPGCNVDVAHQVAGYGFGESLLQAATTLPFLDFMKYMAEWRNNLCDALSTDPRGLLQQKHPGIAQVIKSELLPFPDLTAIALYADPLTSWSNDHVPPENEFIMARQPDLAAIGDFCSRHFSLSGDSLTHRLKDVCAGVVTRAALQLPGKVENTLRDVHAASFHKASWSTHAVASYEIAVPSHLLSTTVPPKHLPDSEGFCTVNIPAVVLNYAKPNLAQSLPPCLHWTPPTSSAEMECEPPECGLGNASEVINLAFEATCEPYSGKEVIDLTGED